jgi:hypothetical protein
MNNSEHWITIEQAAVALGLSVRTVNRHINAGKLQSRLTEGRREVLLDEAAPIPTAAGHVGQAAFTADLTGEFLAADANAISNHDTAAIDCETVLALADNAADKAELAVSAYQTLARNADERVRTTRRLSYAAWSLVGGLAVVAIVSVGWTTRQLTRAAVENQHLQEQVTQATAAAEGMDEECDVLRRALIEAREEAARTEGRLAAYREPAAPVARQTAQPATRPTLVERIASIFEE